jgi:hypothetical protein
MGKLMQYSDLEDAIERAKVRGTHWCWIVYPNADPECVKVFHDGSVIRDREGGPYVVTWLEKTIDHPIHGSLPLKERIRDWRIVVDLLTPFDDPCVLKAKGGDIAAFRIGEDRPYAIVTQCGVAP